MKTWEKMVVGIVVLLVVYYVYTNYTASTIPTTTNNTAGDSELAGSGVGGVGGYTTPTTFGGMTTYGTGPSMAPTIIPTPTLRPGQVGSGNLGHPQLPITRGAATITPRGQGHPSEARLAAGFSVIPVSTTDHPAMATIHPLLNGSSH